MTQKMAPKGKSKVFRAVARCVMAGVSLLGMSLLTSRPAAASTHHHGLHHHSVYARNAYTHSHGHAHTQLASYGVGYSHHHRYYGAHVHSASYYRTHHIRLAAAHYRHSGLQCVPYAREVSHIELSGNAFLWWAEAAGRYDRGSMPVEGAVLNFRAIGRMPLGHVAVVTGIIDSRTILVTQANWVRGTITNDVTMQDVSPNNDWTQVQVELGDSSTWGAAYPTYGFIYNKPASSLVIAANGQGNEVAEAPAAAPISTEAPNRNLQ
jgi:surface antigen